jgi:hypothetical protein
MVKVLRNYLFAIAECSDQRIRNFHLWGKLNQALYFLQLVSLYEALYMCRLLIFGNHSLKYH